MWPFSSKQAEIIETKSELTDPDSSSWEALVGFFSQSSSGIPITAFNAMTVPAVNAAVNLIATSVGTLPAKVYEQKKDGKEPAISHAAYSLVHDESNDWQSAGKVRELVTTDAILHGDGFAFVNKVGKKPVEILHLPRQNVVVEWLDSGEPRYRVGNKVYTPDTIIHLQAPSICGKRGFGLIQAGKDAIGLAILLERTSSRLMKNNSRPGGVLSFTGKMNLESIKRVGESWRAAHGGDKSGGVAVLDNSGAYSPIAFTSVESQHTEQRNFSIGEISRLTRVPVTLLQELSKGTFSNVEQQNLQFLQTGLLPWLKAWTDAYRRTLLSKEERRTYSVEFILDDLLRADTATRTESYAKFRASGVMTANDVRRLENLPALPDGDSLSSPFTTAGTTPANDNSKPKTEAIA